MADQKHLALLRQGVKAWNQWKTENRERIHLHGANLSNANLHGADLSNVNFASANFSDANLRSVNFTYANLYGANFSDADLSSVNFRGADLRSVNLCNADLHGADLCSADLHSTNLSKANFSDADLRGVNFAGANLRDANFAGANLRDANFSDADLRGVNFAGANLRDANLRGIDLSDTHINDANLSGIDLSNLDFSNANLSGINFSNANLSGINFRNANLSGANLSGVNLSGLDFSGANLRDARLITTKALATNFTGATFTGACLEDWHINSETKLNDAVCEDVYLKQNQQERRPSKGSFKPGEFTLLFQKALETVDLIFADGINWNAFFQSFQELRSQYNDENLAIQAIEKKSGGAFVIRLEVPSEADKAVIESQVKEPYEMKLKLLEIQYRTELHAKDREIEIYKQQNTDMLEIVKLQASRPIHTTAIAGSQSMGDRNIHMGSGNYNERIEGNYVQGNYINMSQDLVQVDQQIQDLLQQLQNQGVTVEASHQQVATDIVKQAETNPATMGKLVLWGKAMANKASETTVSEAAKIVFTLALKAAGLPFP